MFNVIDFQNSWKVDFIIRRDRDFSVVEFDRRKAHEVEGIRLTLASPEDVIIAKLEWARSSESDRQLEDGAGVLHYQKEKLDLGYIQEWVSKLHLDAQWTHAKRRAG
jgi:hypothetical protein